MHNYGPVLDRTVWSGPAFSWTGPDCGPRMLDRTVRSFYRSPFSNDKKTGPFSPVQYFWDRTAVRRCWTVQSSLFKRSPKLATVRTGPDRGQSNIDDYVHLHTSPGNHLLQEIRVLCKLKLAYSNIYKFIEF